ncbi:MAG: nucleotidyltransferase domain-containing protein [Bacteroidota bacterium]
MNSQTFGEFIRKARQEQKLSLKQVSELVEYGEKSLSQVERGLKVAPYNIIKPLSEVLKVSFKALVTKYLSEKIFAEVRDIDYSEIAVQEVLKKLEKGEKGTKTIRTRSEIIERIKDYFDTKPIEKAWIFGSFARDTASTASDIDILVRYEKPSKLTLLDIVEMKYELEDRTGRDVDLVEEGQTFEYMKDGIERDKIQIYG